MHPNLTHFRVFLYIPSTLVTSSTKENKKLKWRKKKNHLTESYGQWLLLYQLLPSLIPPTAIPSLVLHTYAPPLLIFWPLHLPQLGSQFILFLKHFSFTFDVIMWLYHFPPCFPPSKPHIYPSLLSLKNMASFLP